uniref:Uncharacterized protein n=1 Tax=Anopheles melas TaxID=34690 RepID=A0A182TIC5_9DIPT
MLLDVLGRLVLALLVVAVLPYPVGVPATDTPNAAAVLGVTIPVLSVLSALICRLVADGQPPRKNVTVSRSRSPSSLADESSRPPRQLLSRYPVVRPDGCQTVASYQDTKNEGQGRIVIDHDKN